MQRIVDESEWNKQWQDGFHAGCDNGKEFDYRNWVKDMDKLLENKLDALTHMKVVSLLLTLPALSVPPYPPSE